MRVAIRELGLKLKNHFAQEIDHMAQCVLQDRASRTPGEEGLQDPAIMEALYRSAKTGAAVALPATPGLDTTRGPALAEKE